jgi:hypothetical protein
MKASNLLLTLVTVSLVACGGTASTPEGAMTSESALSGFGFDLTRDGDVDDADMAFVSAAFGSSIGSACYDARADLNRDGTIDTMDFNRLRDHLGEKTDAPGPAVVDSLTFTAYRQSQGTMITDKAYQLVPDMNFDGVVDIVDFNIIRSSFGTILPAPTPVCAQ